ncbi:CDP-glycerol glycerophosphotransferase family protein [Vibrio tubiashii]|uniref:CDP-glycerol glycerophosphotransferase family protein n=1 Tax=Vibrio tubiashii TaxID=29498 RepID=UPI00234FAB72|nr:CDP-glycerol glycerophosphotransferase family protein [Vibrio tubiashii]WCP67291.1 CDP-glycerol glycerophosphotransferase family protein [Vibrio tubiashii]
MFKVIRIILALADLFFRRNRKRVAIPCINDDEWQGNCAFLYQHLLKYQDNWGIEIVVLSGRYSKLKNNADIGDNIYSLYSFRGLVYLFTSGVVIYHHGPLAGRVPILPWRRISFHINHGVHYKKVELALDSKPKRLELSSFVKTKWFSPYHSVSSHIDALSCCTYYHTKLKDIFVTGIPRNDAFFQGESANFPSTLRSDLIKLDEISQGKKIIAYAPTWRSNGGGYDFSGEELKKLVGLLESKNAILCYAGHPYLKCRKVPSSEGFVDFNFNFNDIQSLLVRADLLITDYSSVWIDFLLRGKPVVSFQFDRATYRDERGFLFDTDTIFPGDIVEDFSELLEAIEKNLVQEKIEHPQYAYVKHMFHEFEDGDNCQRVATAIASLAGWDR